MPNNLISGEIVFPFLVLVTIVWDWRYREFRGIVQQILAALCVSTVINTFVDGLKLYPQLNGAGKAFLLYLFLSVWFYYWAWRKRNRSK